MFASLYKMYVRIETLVKRLQIVTLVQRTLILVFCLYIFIFVFNKIRIIHILKMNLEFAKQI